MPGENARTYRLIKVLNSVPGCRAKKRHGGQFQQGDPDVAGVFLGRSFFIEVKVTNGELTSLQATELQKWREAGAATFVAIYHDSDKKLPGTSAVDPLRRAGKFQVVSPSYSEEWTDLAGRVKEVAGGTYLSFEYHQWSDWLNAEVTRGQPL